MDTTSLPHPEEVPPEYPQSLPSPSHLPTVAQNPLIQETGAVFPNPPTLVMQMPLVDPSPAVFMTPMDVVPIPHIPAGSPAFLAELPACDPFTMSGPISNPVGLATAPNVSSPQPPLPSPPLSTPSPYTLPGAPLLESPLDQPMASPLASAVAPVTSALGSMQPAIPIATAGVTVPGIAHPLVPPAVVSFLPSDVVLAKQEEMASEVVAESVVAVQEMLAE